MKTSTDPRHKKRELKVAKLFAKSFLPGFVSPVDEMIAKAAPDWPLKNINRIDLAVLRVATDEILNSDTQRKSWSMKLSRSAKNTEPKTLLALSMAFLVLY